MKEYQFQYTRIGDTILVLLAAVAAFILTEVLCIGIHLGFVPIIILGFIAAFLLFQALKKNAAHTCTAKLNDTSVIFQFKNRTKTINFSDLVSYKLYNGKNGSILYLRITASNFKMAANNNFCNTDAFTTFCGDIITQLDQYSKKNNSRPVREGSVFTKKGMLYFLISATLIYLFAFFIEPKALKFAIGIAGGVYFFIMWTIYFAANSKNKRAADGNELIIN